jgi:APA family basic amino acid/polyamine antiporter
MNSSLAIPLALPRRGLQRILGVTFGIAIGVGAMVGSGILRTPSLIAGEIPNAALIIGLWVIGGLHAALGVNVYAELSTSMPRAGGSYVYAHRAFGDAIGLIVGWASCLAPIAAVAAGSVSFADFLTLLWPQVAPFRIAVAIALQALLYGANMIGVREGRALQESTSFMKALLLLAFVAAAVGVTWGSHPETAVPPSPAIGAMSIALAYNMVLGAYSGWATPAVFSEEIEQPSRSIPRALIAGLLSTALLYIFVNAALLYALGTRGLAASPLPFTAVLDRIGGPAPAALFAIGAMVTVTSVANAGIMHVSRTLLALSRDGLLPSSLQYINRRGTPNLTFLLAIPTTVALAATGSFGIVFGLIGIVMTLGEVIVTASLLVLRRREPALERPFRAWGYPVLPLLLLAINAALLVVFAGANTTGWLFAVGLSALCVPYALVARHRTTARART